MSIYHRCVVNYLLNKYGKLSIWEFFFTFSNILWQYMQDKKIWQIFMKSYIFAKVVLAKSRYLVPSMVPSVYAVCLSIVFCVPIFFRLGSILQLACSLTVTIKFVYTVYILLSHLRTLFDGGIDNSPIDNFDKKWNF